MELTKEQKILAAKFFAASNTGLLTCRGYEYPQNKDDIKRIYDQLDYEYAQETGEGLKEELEMWLEDFANPKSRKYKTALESIRNEIPFILEENQ